MGDGYKCGGITAARSAPEANCRPPDTLLPMRGRIEPATGSAGADGPRYWPPRERRSTSPRVLRHDASAPSVTPRPPRPLISSAAASRSAVPVAIRKSTSTIRPCRLSINKLPQLLKRAACPSLFRAKRDSGSVVDACVWLPRFSPWKFTVGLPGSSGGPAASPSLRRKLFKLAQASINVPSTVTGRDSC